MTPDQLAELIKGKSPKVHLKCERLGIDEERFIVEGDIGLTEQGVATYAVERVELAKSINDNSHDEKQGLLGKTKNGKMMRWPRGATLTYCVWKPTFDTDEEYQKAVQGMRDATQGWENICGVSFKHEPQFDTKDDLEFGDVEFPVLRSPGGGNTIAMAFFPDDKLKDRIVWVFDGYYSDSSGFDPVGVMRHELGHVLGFRHEHIRPEAPDVFSAESLDETIDLTKYDPGSVMHYVIGDIGNPELTFTELDKAGARLVYGGPDKEYTFAELGTD